MFFSVWLRRGAWRSESQGTASYLRLLFKQADAAIKVIKMGKLIGIAIVGLFYGLAGWIAVQMLRSDHSLAKPGMAWFIMGTVTLVFPAMIYFLHQQQKKILARRDFLASMLESLQ